MFCQLQGVWAEPLLLGINLVARGKAEAVENSCTKWMGTMAGDKRAAVRSGLTTTVLNQLIF